MVKTDVHVEDEQMRSQVEEGEKDREREKEMRKGERKEDIQGWRKAPDYQTDAD